MTLPECLKTLNAQKQVLAKAQTFEQQVEAKKLFLLNNPDRPGLVLPVTTAEATDALTLALFAGQATGKQVATLVRKFRAETLANLARLKRQIGLIETLVNKTADTCNLLQTGSSPPPPPPPPPPPSTDLLLTMEFQSATETRNLKTNAPTPTPNSPGTIAHVQSGQTYGGKITVTGTLPAGYTVYVEFQGKVLAVLGPTGGEFSGVTEPKGFGAGNDVGGFACKTGGQVGQNLPTQCLAEGADVTALWSA